MDFAEPEEHRALRAAVAGIAAKFGPRYYAERAAARRPCAELWQALGDAGFIGVNIPEEYGGGGGGLTELALVCEEIAAAGTPLLLLLVSAAISAEMISEFGTDEQRGTWLPGLASGAVKVVFAITEPDAGSNTLRISTTAHREKGAGEAGGGLDPVQEGFARCHGLQCGFCTPGMMMTARWLLDHVPDPTEEEIRAAISGQICRCTGYENIVRSVRWAAGHEAAAQAGESEPQP